MGLSVAYLSLVGRNAEKWSIEMGKVMGQVMASFVGNLISSQRIAID
jgi:hypothetical protein